MKNTSIDENGAQYLSNLLENNTVRFIFLYSSSQLTYSMQTLITFKLKDTHIGHQGVYHLSNALLMNTVNLSFILFLSYVCQSFTIDADYVGALFD